jgi:hypothetical protein
MRGNRRRSNWSDGGCTGFTSTCSARAAAAWAHRACATVAAAAAAASGRQRDGRRVREKRQWQRARYSTQAAATAQCACRNGDHHDRGSSLHGAVGCDVSVGTAVAKSTGGQRHSPGQPRITDARRHTPVRAAVRVSLCVTLPPLLWVCAPPQTGTCPAHAATAAGRNLGHSARSRATHRRDSRGKEGRREEETRQTRKNGTQPMGLRFVRAQWTWLPRAARVATRASPSRRLITPSTNGTERRHSFSDLDCVDAPVSVRHCWLSSFSCPFALSLSRARLRLSERRAD